MLRVTKGEKTMTKIEVKAQSGRWIKYRSGSRQGQQVAFSTEKEAKDYMRRACMSEMNYRVKVIK